MERCVFCGKSASDVERLIAGPPGIYICNECIELCYSIVSEEESHTPARQRPSFATHREIPPPRQIYDELNRYVIGQDHAKRTLSVALHLHYRRLFLLDQSQEERVEMLKSSLPGQVLVALWRVGLSWLCLGLVALAVKLSVGF